MQAANQKLLHAELTTLLNTISIPPSQLQSLREASLDTSSGVQSAENTLTRLHSALITIDPALHAPLTADKRSSAIQVNAELGSMHAVTDKRTRYRAESRDLVRRLRLTLTDQLRKYESDIAASLKLIDPTKLDPAARSESRQKLWLYSALLLYSRDIEKKEWEDMLRLYEESAKRPYMEEFRANIAAWRHISRRTTGEEADLLFTTQEKETESLVGRKLTVKRSRTLRNEPRQARVDGKIAAFEAVAGTLTEQMKLITSEQNFFTEFFHTSSLDTQEFPDAVAVSPTFRHLPDLLMRRSLDPDRDMARKVMTVMEDIFHFWPIEIQNMVDWTVKQDPLNAVGVLAAMEMQITDHEDTNQEYVVQTLGKMHDRLCLQYDRFAEEQIRAIEDTKVKIKKRKGVITFIRIFPAFCTAIENMLPARPLDIRRRVDASYASIIRTMFECLKFIAKEAPSVATLPHLNEVEDKEALNHHILIIENMHHYIEEVNTRDNPVLEEWQLQARQEMKLHLDSYVSVVIRRPLGKLLDFLESVETLLAQMSDEDSLTAIAARPSHSVAVVKKILAVYDGKEVKRGIETLRRRLEKHFGENDEASKDLLGKVTKACEQRYEDLEDRVVRIVQDVYEDQVELSWKHDDVRLAFRR